MAHAIPFARRLSVVRSSAHTAMAACAAHSRRRPVNGMIITILFYTTAAGVDRHMIAHRKCYIMLSIYH